MNLCIPAMGPEGLTAIVSEHFGGAPYFTIYNTESQQLKVLENMNLHHSHGACQPLKAISGLDIDAVVCGGMGARALILLNQGGVRVYLGRAGTVQEITAAFQRGDLPELTPANACSQHSCQD
ncbi:MAG: NifB/NifX family molybdenum-iron cluster-binding protein [Bacillota bacterium]